jgi:MEMO1 family protein
MSTREASHAGSWYSASGTTLTAQLDDWLAQVQDELPGIGKIPIPGARVVISPHAGFTYSGRCAAWAYKCLDLSKAYGCFLYSYSPLIRVGQGDHDRHTPTTAILE